MTIKTRVDSMSSDALQNALLTFRTSADSRDYVSRFLIQWGSYVLRRWGCSEEEAEEIVQAACVSLQRGGKYDGSMSAKGFLLKLLRWRYSDLVSQKYKARGHAPGRSADGGRDVEPVPVAQLESGEDELAVPDRFDVGSWTRQTAQGEEEQLQGRRDMAAIRLALEQMLASPNPTERRRALVLYRFHFEGWSHEEIAASPDFLKLYTPRKASSNPADTSRQDLDRGVALLKERAGLKRTIHAKKSRKGGQA